MVRERPFARIEQLAPHLLWAWLLERRRHELVRARRIGATDRTDGADEHRHELQIARDRPTAFVAGCAVAPHMARELRAGLADLACDVLDRRGVEAARFCNASRRRFRVVTREVLAERSEVDAASARPLVGAPLDPVLDELPVDEPVSQQHVREAEQHQCLGARPRREPVVGHARCVRQADVADRELPALHLAVDDALRVRVEVVARLQVRGDQQRERRVLVVGRRTIVAAPQHVAEARCRAADVGMAVVAVDAPGLQDAIDVAVVAGTAYVIHDLGEAAFDDRFANARCQRVEHLVPRRALELAAPARPLPLHRVEDAVRVLDLVDRRGALGAVATARTRVVGVAFDLLDLAVLLVDVGDQAARCFAVEANRRHQRVVALHAARPCARIELGPIIPLGWWREVLERGRAQRRLVHADGKP